MAPLLCFYRFSDIFCQLAHNWGVVETNKHYTVDQVSVPSDSQLLLAGDGFSFLPVPQSGGPGRREIGIPCDQQFYWEFYNGRIISRARTTFARDPSYININLAFVNWNRIEIYYEFWCRLMASEVESRS